jgi:hypothetical protein
MAIFTTNSVRHFYVLKSQKREASELQKAGDYCLSETAEGKKYFQYMGMGGMIYSDLIDPKTITHVKYTAGEGRDTKKMTVTLPKNAKLVAGQDYVIRVKVLNHYSPAQEAAMFQFGVVHATNEMVQKPAKFWEALAKSLNANINKGEEVLFTITASETSLEIEEIAQTKNYKRGSISVQPVNFEVYTSESIVHFAESAEGAGDDYFETMCWGEVNTSKGSTTITNAYKIADMEHFYHGERGDVYRDSVAKIGWDTKYMIDNFDINYNTLDIHFAFVDTGTESYRSEKDITLVTANNSGVDLSTLVNSFK